LPIQFASHAELFELWGRLDRAGDCRNFKRDGLPVGQGPLFLLVVLFSLSKRRRRDFPCRRSAFRCHGWTSLRKTRKNGLLARIILQVSVEICALVETDRVFRDDLSGLPLSLPFAWVYEGFNVEVDTHTWR